METMRDLVEEMMAQLQLPSGREVDRAAARRGYRLTYTTVNNIRNGSHGGRYTTPTLEAIAALGGFPRARVYAAAGLPLPGRPFAEELPGDIDYLDRRSRDAILGVVRVLLDASAPTRRPADELTRDLSEARARKRKSEGQLADLGEMAARTPRRGKKQPDDEHEPV